VDNTLTGGGEIIRDLNENPSFMKEACRKDSGKRSCSIWTALEVLSQEDESLPRIVEMRYVGGMTAGEIVAAGSLGHGSRCW
jgi:hypothetical protein